MQRRDFLKLAAGSAAIFLAPVRGLAANQPLLAASFGTLPDGSRIKRIVSAGPVADTFLLSLAPEKLVGLSSMLLDDARMRYMSETVRQLPHTGRIAGRATTFPMEKLLTLKADLIIDIGTTSASYVSTAQRVFEQTQVPYVLIAGRLDSSARQLRLLGDMLGVPERAGILAQCADDLLGLAAKASRYAQERKPARCYFARGADGLETGLGGSMHTEVFDMLKAYNVAADAGSDRLARISLEQLLRWDPDLIITQDYAFFQRLASGEYWQGLRAVKQGRYYLAPSTPFGWLDHPPSLNRLLGIAWGTRVLYPALLPQNEYQALVQRYFTVFYGYTLPPAELDSLDGGLSRSGT